MFQHFIVKQLNADAQESSGSPEATATTTAPVAEPAVATDADMESVKTEKAQWRYRRRWRPTSRRRSMS